MKTFKELLENTTPTHETVDLQEAAKTKEDILKEIGQIITKNGGKWRTDSGYIKLGEGKTTPTIELSVEDRYGDLVVSLTMSSGRFSTLNDVQQFEKMYATLKKDFDKLLTLTDAHNKIS